jgi:DNA-directed RNA polymerase specialized sigma24 family protein
VRRKRGPGPAILLPDDRDDQRGIDSLAGALADRGPEEELARSELAQAVSEEVRGLSEARRTVVRLYLVGYTRDEIADMVGWSEAKTRNLIYRGLADLRSALERRGIGPGDLA